MRLDVLVIHHGIGDCRGVIWEQRNGFGLSVNKIWSKLDQEGEHHTPSETHDLAATQDVCAYLSLTSKNIVVKEVRVQG
jgi:hypothetical protein